MAQRKSIEFSSRLRRSTHSARCSMRERASPDPGAGCFSSSVLAATETGVRLGEGPEWKLKGRIEDLDYCSAKKMAAGSGDAAADKVLMCDPDQNPAGTVDQLMHFQGLCSMLLEQALNCSELADVKFVFDDGKSMLSGHRSVLCSASETFRGMFRSGMREARTGEVHVRGVSRRSFRGFLEWLYLGNRAEHHTRSHSRPAARAQRVCSITMCIYPLASSPTTGGCCCCCICCHPRFDFLWMLARQNRNKRARACVRACVRAHTRTFANVLSLTR